VVNKPIHQSEPRLWSHILRDNTVLHQERRVPRKAQKELSTPDLKRSQAEASQQEKYILYFLYSRRSDRRPDFEFISVFIAEYACVRACVRLSSETNGRSAIQRNRSLIKNAKAHDRVHKVPAKVTCIQTYLHTHLHLGLPIRLFLSYFPTTILHTLISPRVQQVRPSHSP
jgi:hypothetical protein